MADGRDDFEIKVGVDTTEVPNLSKAIVSEFQELATLFSGGIPGLSDQDAFAMGRRLGEQIMRGMYGALAGNPQLARSWIGDEAIVRTRRDAERIESIIRQTQRIASTYGVSLDPSSMSTAGRADTGQYVMGLRAIEQQAERTTRALTGVYAQMAVNAARMSEGFGMTALSATQLARPSVQGAITNVERQAAITAPEAAFVGRDEARAHSQRMRALYGQQEVAEEQAARRRIALGSQGWDGPRAIGYVPPAGPRTGQNLPGYAGGGAYAPRGGFPAINNIWGEPYTSAIPLPPAGGDWSGGLSGRRGVGANRADMAFLRDEYERYIASARAGFSQFGGGLSAAGQARGINVEDYFSTGAGRLTAMKWLNEEGRSYFGDTNAATRTEVLGVRNAAGQSQMYRGLGGPLQSFRDFSAGALGASPYEEAEQARQQWENGNHIALENRAREKQAAFERANPVLGPVDERSYNEKERARYAQSQREQLEAGRRLRENARQFAFEGGSAIVPWRPIQDRPPGPAYDRPIGPERQPSMYGPGSYIDSTAGVHEAATAEEKLGRERRQSAQATRESASAEEAKTRAERGGTGGGRGGGRGGGGRGGGGGFFEEDDEFSRHQQAGYTGTRQSFEDLLRDRQEQRRREQAGGEYARQQYPGGYDRTTEEARRKQSNAYYRYEAQGEHPFFTDDEQIRDYQRFQAEQRVRNAERAQARFGARSDEGFYDPETTARNAQAEARRARENQERAYRNQRLKDYLGSDAPFPEKVFASFRGAHPEDRGASVRGEFKEGFLGSSERLGYQLGQTAKFSVFYGAAYAALFQLSQGFTMALQQAMLFEDGLANLEIITGRGRESNARYADSLGEIAANSGFAPGEGLQAGVAAIGLYDMQGLPEDVQKQQSADVARVATRIAFVSGGDVSDTVTQLAGASRSFGLGAEDAGRIEDTVSVIGKATSTNSGAILSAMANIGTLASGAGFDPEELGAVLGRIMSTTGNTPEAAANALRQVFSKADDPNTTAKLAALGVHTEGTTLAQQFKELAAMDLSQAQQNQIVQAFGRGASGQALQIMLNQQGAIQGLATEARTSPGEGQANYEKIIGTIGGQLRVLGGHLNEFLKDLASTGVFDSLMLVVKALDLFVQALDQLLDLFNMIPREIRGGVFAMIEIATAANLLARAGGPAGRAMSTVMGLLENTRIGRGGNIIDTAGGLLTTGGRARQAGRQGRNALLASQLAGGTAVAVAEDVAEEMVEDALDARHGRGKHRGGTSTAARAASIGEDVLDALPSGVRGGAGRVVSGFSSLAALLRLTPLGLGVAGGAVGGVLLGGYLSARQSRQDREAYNRVNDSALGATTVDEMRSSVARLRAQAKEQDDFGSAIGRYIGGPLRGDYSAYAGTNPTDPDAIRRQANAQEARAKALEEANAAARARSPQLSFGNLDSADAVTNGLKQLSDAGYTAAEQLGLLNTAIGTMTATAALSATSVGVIAAGGGEQFGAEVGGAAGYALQMTKNSIKNSKNEEIFKSPKEQYANQLADWNLENLDINAVAFDQAASDAALKALQARGKDPSKGAVALDKGDMAAIQTAVTQVAEDQVGAQKWENIGAESQGIFTRAYAAKMGEKYQHKQVSGDAFRAAVEAVGPLAQRAGEEVALRTGDTVSGAGTRVQDVQDSINTLAATIPTMDIKDQPAAGRQLRSLNLELLQAEHAEAESMINRVNAIAELQASRLKSDNTIGRGAIGIGALRQTLSLTTDVDERTRIQAQINEAEQEQARRIYSRESAAQQANINPRRTYDRLRNQIARARGNLANLDPNSEEFAKAVDQIHAMENDTIAYRLDNMAAYQTAEHAVLGRRGTAGSPLQKAIDARADADRREADARAVGDPLEINRTSAAAREAAFAEEMARTAYTNSFYDVRGVSRMASTRSGAALAQAQNERNKTYAITGDAQLRNEADAKVTAARQADQDARDADRQTARFAALRPGDNIGRSVVALRNYREELKKYSRGSAEYNNVLIQIASEQQALAESQAKYASNLRQASIDMTDPVAAALEALQSANEAVARADTPEEKASAKVDQKNAQTQLEAAAFQQRLSDAQVADQLGRTSHAAYISYLQSEHDRLSAISVRTRQQQDELDQIDLAIKSETEALTGGGQFNLGDIKVPTPYEVRRMVAAGGGAGVTVLDYSNSNNTVTVNGADMAAVVALITALVSPSATLTTAKVVG